MSFLDLIWGGSRTAVGGTGTGLLERLCHENGWGMDERDGNTIGLHFKGDHVTPLRTVFVGQGDARDWMIFICYLRAEFQRATGLLDAMLFRNDDVTPGGWSAYVENGVLKLRLRYTALAMGECCQIPAHLHPASQGGRRGRNQPTQQGDAVIAAACSIVPHAHSSYPAECRFVRTSHMLRLFAGFRLL